MAETILSGILTRMSHSYSLATLSRMVQIVLLVAVLAMLTGLLWNHFQLISYPVLLDYNEGAMPTITQTIASGSSPYALENQPARISVYPPLYNVLMTPVSMVFGNTLQIHRMVAGVFILASVIICFFATHRASKSVVSSIAASVIFYAGLLFYSTPIASPNSVGLFFFLLSVMVPWFANFSTRSLGVALVAGVLAFYGKQYFVASLGYISLYMFICVSKKRAVLFGFFSVLVFATSVLLVQMYSPYFLDDTVFSVRAATSLIANDETTLIQLKQYSKTNLGLIVFVCIALMHLGFRRLRAEKHSSVLPGKAESIVAIRPGAFEEPLLNRSLNYFWFCLACSLCVIVMIIGRNPGNHMTYLFQLLAPFFLISVFTLSTATRSLKVLILPFALWSIYNSYFMLPRDFSLDMEGWDKLNAVFSGKSNIYGSPLVLPQLSRSNEEIYNNGHTAYFGFGQFKPDFLERKRLDLRPIAIWNQHVNRIHENIEEKNFELIVLDIWTAIPDHLPAGSSPVKGVDLLKKYYRRTQKISVQMANRPGGGVYQLQIWEPRK
jgi:hypothetical protein